MKKLANFKSIALSLTTALVLAQSPNALAKTDAGNYQNYVTDNIQIPFRSGPSYKHKIDRMIRCLSHSTEKRN